MNSVEISGFIPELGLVVVGIVLVECTRQGLNYLQRKNSKPVIRQVIFFPDKQIACKDFFDSVEGCSRIRCDFSHTTTGFRQLLSHIKSARKSIDIAVYCISCFEIADVVLQRHKVGVRVRVITDQSMEIAFGSQNHRFMKDGIRVHTNKPPFLMHHKFFIIDDELLCSGSFNWTSQAVTGNNESVIITNDPWTVEPFCAEFQKLWQETKPGN
ncbi:mitochondrial cardiolipin hydrolase-like [Daphnia pulicaria]|uniref:mitochondrial cardiolipin hydrolase-like n=1 Tax=Daphnia pulicaria TaxID=35523 RepID=UPI001EEC5B00|nr:mitochondrial cardiolipin hydrolase-like [Daphnia pulicaria]